MLSIARAVQIAQGKVAVQRRWINQQAILINQTEPIERLRES
jgi:hypothetical protein